ncbi:unnamed protein product [Ilex paraguariensis]|uniref:Uncharacterized protein n=1 Tax=Ilex paraguariensis TaxID=185542 RepID=A0ABC8UV12_9AQUA
MQKEFTPDQVDLQKSSSHIRQKEFITQSRWVEERCGNLPPTSITKSSFAKSLILASFVPQIPGNGVLFLNLRKSLASLVPASVDCLEQYEHALLYSNSAPTELIMMGIYGELETDTFNSSDRM